MIERKEKGCFALKRGFFAIDLKIKENKQTDKQKNVACNTRLVAKNQGGGGGGGVGQSRVRVRVLAWS